jgi:hypothetical protein
VRPTDAEASRAAPPPWAPLAWFTVLALAVTGVVLALVRPPGPLDQPDPAYQRDGLLRDGPQVAAEVAGVRFGGRPVVLLFVRRAPDEQALRRWLREVPDRADVRVVVPQGPAPDLPVEAVADERALLARAVAMPTPVDGGNPVGYAVVDSARAVRYATLDPEYLSNAFEVATMAGAVR